MSTTTTTVYYTSNNFTIITSDLIRHNYITPGMQLEYERTYFRMIGKGHGLSSEKSWNGDIYIEEFEKRRDGSTQFMVLLIYNINNKTLTANTYRKFMILTTDFASPDRFIYSTDKQFGEVLDAIDKNNMSLSISSSPSVFLGVIKDFFNKNSNNRDIKGFDEEDFKNHLLKVYKIKHDINMNEFDKLIIINFFGNNIDITKGVNHIKGLLKSDIINSFIFVLHGLLPSDNEITKVFDKMKDTMYRIESGIEFYNKILALFIKIVNEDIRVNEPEPHQEIFMEPEPEPREQSPNLISLSEEEEDEEEKRKEEQEPQHLIKIKKKRRREEQEERKPKKRKTGYILKYLLRNKEKEIITQKKVYENYIQRNYDGDDDKVEKYGLTKLSNSEIKLPSKKDYLFFHTIKKNGKRIIIHPIAIFDGKVFKKSMINIPKEITIYKNDIEYDDNNIVDSLVKAMYDIGTGISLLKTKGDLSCNNLVTHYLPQIENLRGFYNIKEGDIKKNIYFMVFIDKSMKNYPTNKDIIIAKVVDYEPQGEYSRPISFIRIGSYSNKNGNMIFHFLENQHKTTLDISNQLFIENRLIVDMHDNVFTELCEIIVLNNK